MPIKNCRDESLNILEVVDCFSVLNWIVCGIFGLVDPLLKLIFLGFGLVRLKSREKKLHQN